MVKGSKGSKSAKSEKSGKSTKSPKSGTGTTNSNFLDSTDSFVTPRYVNFGCVVKGNLVGTGECNFLIMFNGLTLVEKKWIDGMEIESRNLPINLSDPNTQTIVAAKPLIFLLRGAGKGGKDPDPLAHPDNKAGACLDLFPLLLGEQEIFLKIRLVTILTGEPTDCTVKIRAEAIGTREETTIPLTLTMISAHCLPVAKDGTFYDSAIGFNELLKTKAVNFRLSLSTPTATKLVWAMASTAGYAANTDYSVPEDDKFVPQDLEIKSSENCRSVYWNAVTRVLVDGEALKKRLALPFMIDIAGVPKFGKIDVRGRFMGTVDARALLEPGQTGVTVCTKLTTYCEAQTPGNTGPLLELPPASAKASARIVEDVLDEFGHNAYAIIRFDLTEPLVLKSKLAGLYEIIGFPLSEPAISEEEKIEPEEPAVDARKIRTEGGALAIHKELSGLARKGAVPMNQGIKRTAANRLLMRVRSMLNTFPPGDCSYLDWQDLVTAQHAACRRAVTASFAPQPPPPRLPDKLAATRSRIAGDIRIANKHVQTSLKIAGNQPRSLISKTLRCLEERNDMDAKNYLLEALNIDTRNRYLLWILGGQEFDIETGAPEIAGAALRIAVKGEYADGTANAIGWAALHAFHHCNGNMCAAFVAAKKMRKAFSLPVNWHTILDRWIEFSGEEEIHWMPSIISDDNPMLLAAAFFLCLRCYKFSERLLKCVEQDCAVRGSSKLKCEMSTDVFYLRAASLILRRQFDRALDMTEEGIKCFGPSPMMSQMRATCLSCIRNWDRVCDNALKESEKCGSKPCPALLYTGALATFKGDPMGALQRVAQVHKMSPSAHTALLMGRIFAKLGEEWLAERWLAAAVKNEPLLSDAWAMLALLAMYEKSLDKARMMLRTARQVGPISPDIEEELRKVMDIVQLDQLPDSLVKNVCFCEFIE